MKPGRFLLYLVLLAAASVLIWLSIREPPSLVVATHPWIGYETLYLARDFNWLPETISLRDDQTLDESLAALQSGRADAACMTLDEMLRARAAGLPLAAALVLDVSAGADMVLARPGINKPADIAGKRIGFDRNALGALVFEKLLEVADLPADRVYQIDIPPARQLEAWRGNQIDAAISYEPMASALLREGARNLFDSRQMPDTIIDVLAVRADKPTILPLIKTLTTKHFRALAYLRRYQQDAVFRISAREKLSPEEAERMLAGVIFPSLEANRGYLQEGSSGLARAAKILSTLMVKRGLLAQEANLAGLTMPGTLPLEEE